MSSGHCCPAAVSIPSWLYLSALFAVSIADLQRVSGFPVSRVRFCVFSVRQVFPPASGFRLMVSQWGVFTMEPKCDFDTVYPVGRAVLFLHLRLPISFHRYPVFVLRTVP